MDNDEKINKPSMSRNPMRGRPGRMGNPGEKAKDFKQAMKRLFSELKNYRILIIVALVLAVLSSVLSIMSPNRLSDLTNEISKELSGNYDNMEKVKEISLFLIGLYICSAIFTYVQSILMTDVANKFAKSLRSRISQKINKLPLRYFDKHQLGDILSRVTNDVDTIAQTMHQALGTLVSNMTLFIGTIIMMFYTNWIMAITAILASFIGFIFMFLVLKKSQKYFTARQEELGNLNGHIEEIYSGLNVVKVYNGKDEANKKFDELNNKVYECNRKSQFLSGLMRSFNEFYRKFWICCCVYSWCYFNNE